VVPSQHGQPDTNAENCWSRLQEGQLIDTTTRHQYRQCTTV